MNEQEQKHLDKLRHKLQLVQREGAPNDSAGYQSDNLLMAKEAAARACRHLSGLPEDQRTAVILYKMIDLTNEQTALILSEQGITDRHLKPGALKRLVNKGLRTIRQQMLAEEEI
jgi:DNA-directed RNA polymerase specialized sigma24 family protein